MKPCRLMLALALCLLLSRCYGIRLPREPQPVKIKAKDVEKINNVGGVKSVIICKDNDHCSSPSGKYRKLMISTNSSPSTVPITTSSKSLHKAANKVDPLVVEEPSSIVATTQKHASSSSPSLESESESIPAKSQDLEDADITEMDYSPAQRKPPIHN